MSTSIGLHIGGSAYVPASTATFAPQPDPRNPTLAFFLSLLLPGLGQFYCRKNARGAWTLAIFLVSFCFAIGLAPMLAGGRASPFALFWGIFFRVALFLYVFSFLDAYFTAREMSAGTDPFVVESPRIAAILNLLTRGFGYFYLGQRTAGFLVFVGLGLFQGVILQVVAAGDPEAGPLFMEFVLAGLGVHAYLMARKRENEILATIQPAPQFSAIEGLPPAVPVGLAALLALAYLGLSCIGLFLPDYSSINQASSHLSQSAQAAIYSNPMYHIEFQAPATWSLENQDAKLLVSALRNDSVCSANVRMVAWSPLLPVAAYSRALAEELAKPQHSGHIAQDVPATLDGLPGRSILLTFRQRGLALLENQIVARKSMTLYILTSDSLVESAGDCQSDFQFIRQHLTLPR